MTPLTSSFAAWCRQEGKEKLLALYDADANERSAEDIHFSSAKPVHWRCPVCQIAWTGAPNKLNRLHPGHYNVIKKRHEETFCPYCKGARHSPFYNVATEFSWVKSWWDPQRNVGEDGRLENHTPESKKKFYLRYPKCGLQFPEPLQPAATADGRRCPVCEGGRLRGVTPETCLAYRFPRISEELADDLNGGITGQNIRPGYHAGKLWFQCPRGHLYQAWVYNRTYRDDNCPQCGRRRKTSFPEQAFLFYIRKCSWDARNNWTDPYGHSIVPHKRELSEY